MLIAILDFEVAPADQNMALDHLLFQASDVRKMPGNIAFRAYVDPMIDTRVTVVHEWESEQDFAVYLASPCFAGAGQKLRPIMTSAPVSRRFSAKLLETVR